MLKSVYIKLNTEKEVEEYEAFQRWCEDNITDVTKKTKDCWRKTVKEEK